MSPILEFRPATKQERIYTYIQSFRIQELTGSCGWLCGSFGFSGEAFHTTWYDIPLYMRDANHQAELHSLVNELRYSSDCHEILENRNAMSDYCRSTRESSIDARFLTEYAFRADTETYACVMRLNPQQGKSNFFLFFYERERLNAHLSLSADGVRILKGNYAEKFRVPDGERLRMIDLDGSFEEDPVRFIDSTHIQIGDGYDSPCYDLWEFADYMRLLRIRVIPIRSSLPEHCLGFLPESGEIIQILRGEDIPLRAFFPGAGKENNRWIVEIQNRTMGISKAQAAAMMAGVLSGWEKPDADLQNYDAEGNYLHHPNSRRKRGS